MKPPFVLNESKSIGSVGDIDVFKGVSELELKLEPWYVDESHFIFDSERQQLEITAVAFAWLPRSQE